MSMYGTKASYEEQSGYPDGLRKTRIWAEKERENSIRPDELLECSGVAAGGSAAGRTSADEAPEGGPD